MRILVRSLLVAVLIATLVETPVLAAPSASLGIVIQARGAQLDNVAAVGGATVYPGDKLVTSSDGSVRLRAGTGQVYLLANSAATFSGGGKAFTTLLQQGTAGFSSPGGEAIELRTADAVVRPKTSQPTHARLTILNSKQLVVSSLRGPLELRVGDETYTIAENTAYRVDLDREAQDPQGEGAHSAKKRRTVLVLIAVGAAGGLVGYVIARAIESPSDIF